ncbi:MAG: hypothetical protein ABH851_01810 [Methanobacteriota archaeon]
MALRGLGYTHAEVAGKLGLKPHQITYTLAEVNEEAREKGDSETYLKIIGAGVLPKVIGYLEKIRV